MWHVTNFSPVYNPGCSGVGYLPDNKLYTYGGDVGSAPRGMGDGRNKIMAFDPAANKLVPVGTLQKNRWYPTPLTLPSGKVLIVGGSDACLVGPTWDFAELWDPAAPGKATTQVTMPDNFVKFMGLNWLLAGVLFGGTGDILWFVEKGGAITDGSFKHIVDLPPFPPTITYCTMFPNTSSISALSAGPPSYDLSFVIFGGVDCKGDVTTKAATTSLRLDITKCGASYCFGKGWEVEDMLGVPRVMGDSTLLPNGKVLLHGGAQFGGANANAGWSTKANFQSLMYDPYKPAGQRYSKMDFAPIARVYHSANCLDPSGKVLVAGCENCGQYQQLAPGMSLSPDAPLEMRLEWAVPAEIGMGVARPVITAAPKAITKGTAFKVSYTYPGGGVITRVSLAAPCAATHSINMGQRVIFLEILASAPAASTTGGGTLTLAAPPASLLGQALAGPLLLFLVADGAPQGPTYSEGAWMTLN
ncbi:hypothetical protein HYH02_000652 [Chlamydomonas schloesseri]|uniref:Galactose oxidase-like Early set domain-containing protein n=1 Tax=Chlamydomonas schloesseri TaxID=2026947 RepID=A0A836BDN0_9CHLO|nr:hypothetical protein HYH02_000652 [Chlamydomonas schloesseri]|eukprot:KAG2454820.1 hypothetical protein HYH02_000652 [Chlamydomonas schloesseri]